MRKFLFVAMMILGVGVMLSSCESKKSAIDGYEWLEGKWVTADCTIDLFYNCVIITPDNYKMTSFSIDGGVVTDLTDKTPEVLKIETSYVSALESDFKSFDMYYIDEQKQQIFWLYDFDAKVYMEKIK